MSARFQAWMDWREEGAFRPQQFAPGTKERAEYEAEQATIEQQEAERNEHYDNCNGQIWHRENNLPAEF